MFKLPEGLPTLKSSAQEWADFAEYCAIKQNKISLLDLVKRPQIISDEIEIEGIEDDSDLFNNKANEISNEIRNRIKISNKNYPFNLINNDYSLEHIASESANFWVYKFLLFATRLNMTKEKIKTNNDGTKIDGTQIFEKLSAEVARIYFGEKSDVDILGTSESGGFRTKLKSIVQKIGEGQEIHENLNHRPQDDKVDLIAWKGFTDKRPSQLIAFGQCKTGTSWQEDLSELNAEVFCKTWFTRQPVVTPLKMFFCAQYFPKENWVVLANTAGLVFDRFRILDYLPNELPAALLDEIKFWTTASINSIDFQK